MPIPQPTAIAEAQAESASQNPTTAHIKLVERSSTPGKADRPFQYAIFSILVTGLLAALVLLRLR
jgi:hypothetical protein